MGECFVSTGFSTAVTFYSSLLGSLRNGDTPSARDTRLSTANSNSTEGFRPGTSGRAAENRTLRRPAVHEYARELGDCRSCVSFSDGSVRAEHLRNRSLDFVGTDVEVRRGMASLRF